MNRLRDPSFFIVDSDYKVVDPIFEVMSIAMLVALGLFVYMFITKTPVLFEVLANFFMGWVVIFYLEGKENDQKPV